MIRNLNQVVELVAILWCMANFFGKKVKITVYVIFFLLLNLMIFEGINQGVFEKYVVLLTYFNLYLYGMLQYGKDVKTTLLNCFLTTIVVLVLQMVFYLPIYYIFGAENVGEGLSVILVNCGTLLGVIVLRKRVKWKEFSDFLLNRRLLLAGISLFILVCLGKEIYYLKKSSIAFSKEYIQVLLFFLLFFFALNEWKKAKVDAERKRVQIEVNRLYYAAYDELIEIIRERQHDLKNHISAIYGMIYTTDNYDDLAKMQEEYCQYIMDRNEETKLLLSAGNPLIAGFMYSKLKEAKEQGIEVNYKIKMEKVELKVPEYEIIEMLGILFDNAMEALEMQKVEKIIYVNIIYINGKLDISVANRSEEYSNSKIEEFFRWNFSTKGIGHGIGLTKLKKMVHENEGEIVVSNEEYDSTNFLQFEICLPLCYE